MLSYILPFIVLILVVVFIHEYGHYYFAKRYGVGVLKLASSIDFLSLFSICKSEKFIGIGKGIYLVSKIDAYIFLKQIQ